MSYTFEVGDDTVWDPALRVGQLFLGQVEAVAGVLGLPSGLIPQRDGTCQVDPDGYAAFYAAFQAWYLKSRHPELLFMTEGLITVALTVLLRTGQQPPAGGGEDWAKVVAAAAERARRWA